MQRVLVIDDEVELATLTTLLLKKKGYQVRALTQATESIEAAEIFKPDLILLDVRLGVHDGRHICRLLKTNEPTKDIKIILYSAYHEHKEDYKDYGADDFLGKPFEMEQLLEKISLHLAE